MSCSVGCRPGLDPVLLRLWCKLAAVALMRPLAWVPPYAVGAALKKQKKKKKKKVGGEGEGRGGQLRGWVGVPAGGGGGGGGLRTREREAVLGLRLVSVGWGGIPCASV